VATHLRLHATYDGSRWYKCGSSTNIVRRGSGVACVMLSSACAPVDTFPSTFTASIQISSRSLKSYLTDGWGINALQGGEAEPFAAESAGVGYGCMAFAHLESRLSEVVSIFDVFRKSKRLADSVQCVGGELPEPAGPLMHVVVAAHRCCRFRCPALSAQSCSFQYVTVSPMYEFPLAHAIVSALDLAPARSQ
jgi:hypothetical protein